MRVPPFFCGVVTASGGLRPVVWLGHRAVDCRKYPAPEKVWPMRIAAGVFGEGLPKRDLWVSPGHNIACLGKLIPACALANGHSVAQTLVDQVEYWHVELDAHDILLAEGLPAESYLDCGNRTDFINGGAFVEAHPDFAPRHEAETCLPLVKEGPEVAAVKARLIADLLAQGLALTAEPRAHIVADGKIIMPMRLSERRLVFVLPTGAEKILLRSKTFVPAHCAPESSDSRALGLCLARLLINGADFVLDRDEDLGPGWHEAEWDNGRVTQRWTTGETPLPAAAHFVVLDLAGHGLYWQEPTGRRLARAG